MDLTPKMRKVAAVSYLPLLALSDETGTQEAVGHVMAITPADPAYGADAGTRVAFICDESPTGQGALVSVALDAAQMPELAVGQRVRVYGWQEALTAELETGLLELGVLSALDIQPA